MHLDVSALRRSPGQCGCVQLSHSAVCLQDDSANAAGTTSCVYCAIQHAISVNSHSSCNPCLMSAVCSSLY
jgi:hypothetical protein